MRRAAVPIAFVASYTLIAPIGVAVLSSPSFPAPLAPAAARPALRVSAIVPSPDRAIEQIVTARPGAEAARAVMRARSALQSKTRSIVSGDGSWGVARHYGVPVESLAEVNRLSPKSLLRTQRSVAMSPHAANQVIVATEPTKAAPQDAKTALATVDKLAPEAATAQTVGSAVGPSVPPGSTVAHVVAPGETVWGIANTYGARVEDVLAHNGLSEGDVITPGRRLVIAGRLTPVPSRSRERVAAPDRPAISRVRPAAPVLEPRSVDEPRKAQGPRKADIPNVPATIGPDRTFLWPTHGVITSRFGWRRYRRHHEGVDVASPHGTPIFATRDGVVEFAGTMGGYGQVVFIYHGSGLVTVYGHASELLVAAGQFVKRGQMIARVGCTGSCTGAHVHFEVRINGVAVNPLQYLR